MSADPGDEVVADLGQAILVAGVVEQVTGTQRATGTQLVKRAVQVRAVACLAGDRLRRQAGPQPAAERDAPHRLPVQHLVVRRAQGWRVPDRDLVLPVAE